MGQLIISVDRNLALLICRQEPGNNYPECGQE